MKKKIANKANKNDNPDSVSRDEEVKEFNNVSIDNRDNKAPESIFRK